jgi:tRNA A37 threonylcarbamoyladenosine dehydratase
MANQFVRTELIYGKAAIDLLKKAHVAIFGVGGVGGYVVEALARSGVSHFTLIDNDKVSISNCNRQIVATLPDIDRYKVDVMKERILSINKNAIVETRCMFFLPENQNEFNFKEYDYVVDCIDTIKAKIALVLACEETKTPLISSMGAGNKVNPMGFMVSDIYKTEMDPLAKVMRTELRKRKIKHLKVVYSKEKPLMPLTDGVDLSDTNLNTKKITPGSSAFVPPAAGLLIASEVVRDITNSVARVELKR